MALDAAQAQAGALEVSSWTTIPENDHRIVWGTFLVVIPLLVGIDLCCLTEKLRGEVSMSTASQQCFFWIAMGLSFNSFIWAYLGRSQAISWLGGYVLEYMLSIDNLLVWNLIFTTYRTPKNQVHRALCFAIGWSFIPRFLLFAVGAGMFNLTLFFHWVFGGILVYSGVKIMFLPEEAEADPKESWAARCFTHLLPLHEGYGEEANFFIWNAQPMTSSSTTSSKSPQPERVPAVAASSAVEMGEVTSTGPVSAGMSTVAGEQRHSGVKATMLLLVVLTVIAVDLVFAVDSVTAKVAMVSQYDDRIDLVLNFTSSAFTMLTLRSLYFVVASLVHLFRFMKSGVALVLVLIGVRLMFSAYIDINEGTFCLIILGIFLVAILASVLVRSSPDPKALLQVKALEDP